MQRAIRGGPLRPPKMLLLYDLFVSVAIATTVLPWHLLLAAVGLFPIQGLRERTGTCRVPERLTRRRILVHAVSVGEVAAAEPVIRELLATASDVEVVLTAGNRNGLDAARRLQGVYPAIVVVQLLPWDARLMIGPWLRRLRADLTVIVETELWPNLIRESARLGGPVCLVNGRVYPRDVPRYRLARGFFRRVFESVACVAAQSGAERERFVAIGARPEQITVIGNVKFDASVPRPAESDAIDRVLAGVEALLVGGSTHDPEERWLLESWLELRTETPGLRLVLAPRRTNRAAAVAHLAARAGVTVARWSALDRAEADWDVLILDQTGWLTAMYSRATVVVIGGSFIDHGGQNPLEAALHRRAIVMGPDVAHFESIVSALRHADAIVSLSSHRELTAALRRLLRDPDGRRTLGERAFAVLDSHRGIAREYVRTTLRTLEASHPS